MYTLFDEKIHYNEVKIEENVIEKLNALHKYPYLLNFKIVNEALFNEKNQWYFF